MLYFSQNVRHKENWPERLKQSTQSNVLEIECIGKMRGAARLQRSQLSYASARGRESTRAARDGSALRGPQSSSESVGSSTKATH